MTDPLSVVIPAHEPSEELRACLKAFAACDPAPKRVILVLDGPAWPKESLEFVPGWVEVVPLERPQGAAAARNAGWRRATSPWIVFVDSDVTVREDFLGRVLELIQREKAPDAFFGSYDSEPTAPGLFSRYRNLLHHFTHQNAADEASTFWAGCGVVRRAALAEVGGFDETFLGSSIEDIELGMRLRGAGFRIRVERALQVTHLKQWRFDDIWFTDVHRRALPWARLLMETGHASRDLNLSHASRLSGVLAVAATLAVALSWVWPVLGLAGLGTLALMFLLNARFYALLFRAAGWSSVGPGMFFHYLYYLTSSLVFAFALVEARLRGKPQIGNSL